jgi:hypothetical protein
LAGFKVVAKSNFKPLASWFSHSTFVTSILVVFHVWVRVMPFLELTYLPSISPVMAADLLSRLPVIFKITGFTEVVDEFFDEVLAEVFVEVFAEFFVEFSLEVFVPESARVCVEAVDTVVGKVLTSKEMPRTR